MGAFLYSPKGPKPPGDSGEVAPATRDTPRKHGDFCYRGGDEAGRADPHDSQPAASYARSGRPVSGPSSQCNNVEVGRVG